MTVRIISIARNIATPEMKRLLFLLKHKPPVFRGRRRKTAAHPTLLYKRSDLEIISEWQ
jgi:hypothetical protein